MKFLGKAGKTRAADPVYACGCAACKDSGCYSWCEMCEGSGEPCFAPVEGAGAAVAMVALVALVVFVAALAGLAAVVAGALAAGGWL
jgi:hypothetical protein